MFDANDTALDWLVRWLDRYGLHYQRIQIKDFPMIKLYEDQNHDGYVCRVLFREDGSVVGIVK